MADSLTELVTSGVVAGTYAVDDPAATAVLLCNALHHAYHQVWGRDEPRDRVRTATAVETFFRRAILVNRDG